MYKVFNMGHRLEVYIAPENAAKVIEIAGRFGIEARIVGRVEASETNRLTLVTEKGTFEY